MKQKNNALVAIFLGIVCMISVLLIQYVWLKKAIQAQHSEVVIRQREDSLNNERSDLRIYSALRESLANISRLNNFTPDNYDAIRQSAPNVYYVEYEGSLNSAYLERLLKREFYNWRVNTDFQYAIYNCFDSTIQYSNLINFSIDSLYESTHLKIKHPDLKFDLESHYFAVYFPELVSVGLTNIDDIGSPWIFLILVTFLSSLYLAYSIYIIAKQKRLADIKTDFINNMTHELKTPIATIKLSSNVLMDQDFSNDPERLKRYAEIIYRENKRLEGQVERVLNIAKMDKDTTPLNKKFVNIHALIDEIADTFNFNLEEIGGKLKVELNATKYVLFVDPLHIKNIIYNLLENAVKYRREEVELSLNIKTFNLRRDFVIEISDNGIGIAKDDRTLIFDKFYRVPKGDRHDVKGFGLGLYYVKTIVEQHGGRIEVRSNIGKGSTFVLSFPVESKDKEAHLNFPDRP